MLQSTASLSALLFHPLIIFQRYLYCEMAPPSAIRFQESSNMHEAAALDPSTLDKVGHALAAKSSHAGTAIGKLPARTGYRGLQVKLRSFVQAQSGHQQVLD
jgi:hypothetical protein